MAYVVREQKVESPAPASPILETLQDNEIQRQVQSEVSRIRGKAEVEGREQGINEGRALIAPQLAALQSAANALLDAIEKIAHPLSGKEREIADLITETSFCLAKHLVGREVALNRNAVTSLVRELLDEAIANQAPGQRIVVKIAYADLEIVRSAFPGEAIEFKAADIAQGGVILDLISATNDPFNKLEWDATIEGRLKALGGALRLTPAVGPEEA